MHQLLGRNQTIVDRLVDGWNSGFDEIEGPVDPVVIRGCGDRTRENCDAGEQRTSLKNQYHTLHSGASWRSGWREPTERG